MVLSNGSMRARHVSSLVNRTDRCGGDRKRGLPAMSMYYPRIAQGVACSRAKCSRRATCVAPVSPTRSS